MFNLVLVCHSFVCLFLFVSLVVCLSVSLSLFVVFCLYFVFIKLKGNFDVYV